MIDGTVLMTQDLSSSARLAVIFCVRICIAIYWHLRSLLGHAILILDIASAIDLEDVNTAS